VVDFAKGATREIGLQGGIALLMVSEHEAEEGVEEAVAFGWLRRLGLQPYRLRVWALLSPRVCQACWARQAEGDSASPHRGAGAHA
jgi:hypothetical protein